MEAMGIYASKPACVGDVYQTGRNQNSMVQNGLEWREHKGSQPNVSIPKMLGFLRKKSNRKWTYEDLGKNFWLVDSNDMNILYAGHAVKK